MRTVVLVAWTMVLSAGLMAACQGGGKQEIPLLAGQTYQLQSSGKMKVSTSFSGEGAQAIHKLRVKRKNDGAAASTPGCWACTDCICNSDDCACTECTSC